MILLDTDICVSLLRGNSSIAERLRSASFGASVSFMTAAELAYGAEKSSRPAFNRSLVERFLLTVPVIESEHSSMRLYGRIKAGLEAAGSRLADADIFVAAAAIDRDLILATGNLKHFAPVPGLKAEDWLKA